MQNRRQMTFWGFLFFLSGIAALIYESIWAQYLKLLLGHAAYSQTIVLIIFMGGMTGGALLVSRFTPRIKNLLKAYAIVELILGLMGACFHPLFTTVTPFLQNTILPSISDPMLARVVLWIISACLILPQSLLLGATFPLMTGGILRRYPADESGRLIALLYFVNSLGGGLGVLISGFVLIKLFGLPGTIQTAGLINIFIAWMIWVSSKTPESTPVATPSTNTHSWPYFFLAASFVTGLASFLYEVGWIRMLALVMGASTQAFELMLSAFILGLAFGSLTIQYFMPKIKSPLLTLGGIQIAMGLLALATLPIYNFLFELLALFLEGIKVTEPGYILSSLFNQGLCFLVMLPTTFCAGMTLPLLTQLLLQKRYGERAIGEVYAANTLGAILGVILAQQVIMPHLGLKFVIGFGGLFDLGLGLAVLTAIFYATHRLKLGLVSLIAVTSAFAIFAIGDLDRYKMISGVFRTGRILSPQNTQLLFYKDGKTATVSVTKTEDILAIASNGKVDASINLQNLATPDESTQVLMGLLPFSLNPDIKTVAVVGLGSGMTTHALLSIPSISEVNTLEIEPMMIKGARLFGERVALTFNDKRSHIITEDARTFFLVNKHQYDLIVSEPSNPWVSGVSSLFTSEYYAIVKKALAENGLFAQWFHLYDVSPGLVGSVVQALEKHFPHYAVYFTNGADILIIASKTKASLNTPSAQTFSHVAIKKELERIGIKTEEDLLFRKLGDKHSLSAFFQAIALRENSDFYPVLELYANRDRFLMKNSYELSQLKFGPLPSLALLNPEGAINMQAITPHFSYAPSQQIIYAQQIYRNLVEGRKHLPNEPRVRTLIYEFMNLESLCQLSSSPIWLKNLHNLFEETYAYLNDTQMKNLWYKVKSTPCLLFAPQSIKQWMAVYDSLVEKNYSALLIATRVVLDKRSVRLSPRDYHFALGLNLFASIKLNQITEAKALLEEVRLPKDPPLYIQMLTAHINNFNKKMD